MIKLINYLASSLIVIGIIFIAKSYIDSFNEKNEYDFKVTLNNSD